MSCSFCSCTCQYDSVVSACYQCLREGKALIDLVNKANSSKGFSDAANMVKGSQELKEREAALNDKLDFLSGMVVAYRGGIHTDICLKPNNGPSIPAHKALLAVRSSIFNNVLASDRFKAAPSEPTDETVSVPEMGHDELQSLLEFLYIGSLPDDQVTKHVHCLYTAAHKYEIPFLFKFCGKRMLDSLNASNCLDVLGVSDICSDSTLKDATMNFIVSHMEDVAFSPKYDAFMVKNPQLTAEITRALLSGVHLDKGKT